MFLFWLEQIKLILNTKWMKNNKKLDLQMFLFSSHTHTHKTLLVKTFWKIQNLHRKTCFIVTGWNIYLKKYRSHFNSFTWKKSYKLLHKRLIFHISISDWCWLRRNLLVYPQSSHPCLVNIILFSLFRCSTPRSPTYRKLRHLLRDLPGLGLEWLWEGKC